MKQWIAAQGGNAACLEDFSLFKQPKYSYDITAEKDGYISSMNTEKIGISSVILGAGRESKEDSIDFAAGIVLKKKTGDAVKKG